MNKERRALLRKAADMVYEAKVMVARANDDEENAYDNLPDGIRDSDRGDTMQETIDQLDSIIEELDNAYDQIREITGLAIK